ncbi:MAG: extracellular solute-binding protein [Oscillospiraceae bacterium]|nr:extracellular solute-binding protein [Oscillospiraceae bacterium]
MKKAARITTVFFIVGLICMPFLSCKTENLDETENDENAGYSKTTKEQKPELELPDVKYGGYEFRILNSPTVEMFADTTIVAEEETGESVNDAVHKRNRMVEERFDVKIVEILTGRREISPKASNSIKSGADDYDLFMLGLDEGVGIAQNKMVADYNIIPYLNLSQPWWDRDMAHDLSIGNQNYFVAGDFSLMHYGKTQGVFFNKQLLQDLGIESPYDIIAAGKWTFDKFHEMGKGASKDLDGDGAFTDKDQYGFVAYSWVYANAFVAGAGQQMITKDADGMHVFRVGEKYVEAYQKLMQIMHDGDMLLDGLDGQINPELIFLNNQSLFYSSNIHSAVGLRGMETDFGIIPLPKYDETQGSYHTYVYPPPAMLVPVTASDLGRTGVILEALCYESTDTVVKAYYNDLLKTKISRDDESEAMLDVIFENRIYSITDIYYMPETYEQLYKFSRNQNANLMSWIEQHEGKITAAVEKNNQLFNEN